MHLNDALGYFFQDPAQWRKDLFIYIYVIQKGPDPNCIIFAGDCVSLGPYS